MGSSKGTLACEHKRGCVAIPKNLLLGPGRARRGSGALVRSNGVRRCRPPRKCIPVQPIGAASPFSVWPSPGRLLVEQDGVADHIDHDGGEQIDRHHHHPVQHGQNARQDVTTGSCAEKDGAWVRPGVVKNSAKAARTDQIVVDFVSQPGHTVLDTTIVDTVSVKPGKSLAWSAKSTPGLTRVACVIRQVQVPT